MAAVPEARRTEDKPRLVCCQGKQQGGSEGLVAQDWSIPPPGQLQVRASSGVGGQDSWATKVPTGPSSGPSSLSFLLMGPGKAVSPTLQTKPGWVGSLPPQSKASSVASGVLGRGPGTLGHINVNKPHSPRFQLVCDQTHTRKQISAHDCPKDCSHRHRA